MATNPFHDLNPGHHWAHAQGPDGPCVLLITWQPWLGQAVNHEDGDRVDTPHQDAEGVWWLHKWRVSRVEPVETPDYRP